MFNQTQVRYYGLSSGYCEWFTDGAGTIVSLDMWVWFQLYVLVSFIKMSIDIYPNWYLTDIYTLIIRAGLYNVLL